MGNNFDNKRVFTSFPIRLGIFTLGTVIAHMIHGVWFLSSKVTGNTCCRCIHYTGSQEQWSCQAVDWEDAPWSSKCGLWRNK